MLQLLHLKSERGCQEAKEQAPASHPLSEYLKKYSYLSL